MPRRRSVPMPWRTADTSAPTLSQRFAISLMNEIFTASSELAAYFVISALALSITRMGAPPRTNGAYRSFITSAARWLAAPITTRSGFRKSSIAAPSFMNSGFDTTSKGCDVLSARILRSAAAVPTGTVLVVTTMR